MTSFRIAVCFLFFNGCFGGGFCSPTDTPYVPERPDEDEDSECLERSGTDGGLDWMLTLGEFDPEGVFTPFDETIVIEDGFQGGSHLRFGVEISNATFGYSRFTDRVPFHNDEAMDGWVQLSAEMDGEEIAYVARPFDRIFWRPSNREPNRLVVEDHVQFLGAPDVDMFLDRDVKVRVTIDFCGMSDFYEVEKTLLINDRIDE